MKGQFDSQLRKTIIQAFENYDVDYNKENWELLKNKLIVKRRKRRFIIFYWSMAASVALLIGSMYFFNNEFTEPKQANKLANESKSLLLDTVRVEKTSVLTFKNEEISNSESFVDIVKDEKSFTKLKKEVEHTSNNNQIIDGIDDQDKMNKMDFAIQVRNSNRSKLEPPVSKSIDFIYQEDYERVISLQANELNNIYTLNTQPLNPDDSIWIQEPIVPYPPEDDSKSTKVKYGIALSPFISYSDQTYTSTVNYGGGFVTDILLYKRFSFAPGVLIAAQQIEFTNNVEKMSQLTNTAFESEDVTSINLIVIDIPLNFRYKFARGKKTDYFIGLGASSIFYVKQDIKSVTEEVKIEVILNSFSEIISVTETIQTVEEDYPDDALNKFEPFSYINFSLGFNYRLSRKINFTIQPFLKYPIKTLTKEQFKIGTGGLSLQLLF
jgi:hypothetical protein